MGDEHEINQAISILGLQIYKNIQERIDKGENEMQNIRALNLARKGQITEDTQRLVENMIIEANAQLDLLKLPQSFKTRIEEITHHYKKQVANHILNQSIRGLIDEQREEIGHYQFGQKDKKRDAIELTPELMLELDNASRSLSLEQISKESRLADLLLSGRKVSVDLERQSMELIKSDEDAKMHRIAINPNNEPIPVNIESMTEEELMANGITRIRGAELEYSTSGLRAKGGQNRLEENSQEIINRLERIYAQRQGSEQPPSPETTAFNSPIEEEKFGVHIPGRPVQEERGRPIKMARRNRFK